MYEADDIRRRAASSKATEVDEDIQNPENIVDGKDEDPHQALLNNLAAPSNRGLTMKRSNPGCREIISKCAYIFMFIVCAVAMCATCSYALHSDTPWYHYKLDEYGDFVVETYNNVTADPSYAPVASLMYKCRALFAAGLAIELIAAVGVVVAALIPYSSILVGVTALGVAILAGGAFLYFVQHPAALEKAGICVSSDEGPCQTFYGDIISSDEEENNLEWHPLSGWMMCMLSWPLALIIMIESIWARVSPQ